LTTPIERTRPYGRSPASATRACGQCNRDCRHNQFRARVQRRRKGGVRLLRIYKSDGTGSLKTVTDFHVGEDLIDLRSLLTWYGGSNPVADSVITVTAPPAA
jgi:hypothetical protein